MRTHFNGHDGANGAIPRPRSSIARALTDGLAFDTDASACAMRPYIVKGIFGAGDLIALFGPSGGGKTFVAMCMAYAIAHGQQIFGRRVRRFAVLYVGLEGQTGLAHRMAGAASEYGSAGKLIARLTLPVTLASGDVGDAGCREIVAAAERLAVHSGEAVGLIIVDTLARAMAGGDENSAQDMGRFIARLGDLSGQIGAAVMVVHHCGKDASRGMRGSSALFAACDAVIQIDDARSIALDKAKEGETGPLGSFSLKQIALGVDDDGDQITTCVVHTHSAAADATRSAKSIRVTGAAKRALDILKRMQGDGETVAATAADLDLHGVARMPVAFLEKAWREKCKTRRLTAEGKADAERQAFHRARDKLIDCSAIGQNGDFVWLIGSVGQHVTIPRNADATSAAASWTGRDKPDKCHAGQAEIRCDIHGHPSKEVSRVVTSIEPEDCPAAKTTSLRAFPFDDDGGLP